MDGERVGVSGCRSDRSVLFRDRLAARLWLAACLPFLAHVACAFPFVHGWSHAAAYSATALRTVEAVGWNWGGGAFIAYAQA